MAINSFFTIRASTFSRIRFKMMLTSATVKERGFRTGNRGGEVLTMRSYSLLSDFWTMKHWNTCNLLGVRCVMV